MQTPRPSSLSTAAAIAPACITSTWRWSAPRPTGDAPMYL